MRMDRRAALLWISNVPIKYYGTASDLQGANYGIASGTVGSYMVFAGGAYTSNALLTTAYNASLVRSYPSNLSSSHGGTHAYATIGNYFVIAGDCSTTSASSVVQAYNNSLTLSTPTALSQARVAMQSATVGNYAIFCGGETGASGTVTRYATVDAYNKSLTRSTPTALSSARYFGLRTGGGGNIGNYSIIAGGNELVSGTSTLVSTVESYNTSLTRTTRTSLGTAKIPAASAKITGYLLIVGGNAPGNTFTKTVDVYNTSLVHSTAESLTKSHGAVVDGVALGGNAIFAGTSNPTAYAELGKTVEIYNKDLVHSTLTVDSLEGRGYLRGAALGSYAVFAGGTQTTSPSTYYSSVDVFTVNS